MLKLETHLECVLAVNLGQIVCDLECGTNFVRGRKALPPKVCSPLMPMAGSPPFSASLRNSLYSELPGDIAQIVRCRGIFRVV